MQPRRRFVDFVILDNRNDNGQPKRDKNDKSNHKRLHIKEENTPRKIEDKADGIDEQGVVLFGGFLGEDDCRADPH